MSLEALLTVVQAIEHQSRRRVTGGEWAKEKFSDKDIKRQEDNIEGNRAIESSLKLKGSGHLAGKMAVKNGYENEVDEDEVIKSTKEMGIPIFKITLPF